MRSCGRKTERKDKVSEHMLDRREFMKFGAICASSFALAPTCLGQRRAKAVKPNVVLLLAEPRKSWRKQP